MSILVGLVLALCGGRSLAVGQGVTQGELTSQEAQPSFKLEVQRNLVLVRVVVRDSKGRAVGGLAREDFRLLDNGKPQVIAHFAVELPSSKIQIQVAQAERDTDVEALPETALSPSTPQRYLAMFFDDIHMQPEDVIRTRDAADRYLAASLQPGDRVGIFTSSGQTILDFSDDRAKLHAALFQLRARPIVGKELQACPEISDFQAYMIIHRQDPIAVDVATSEAFYCYYNSPAIPPETAQEQARFHAEGDAARILNQAEFESEHALRGLYQLARRIAGLPGQRSIVLVSPGFLKLTQEERMEQVVEQALRSNVIINTLDARGLFVSLPLGDASQRPLIIPERVDLAGKKALLLIERADRAADVLRNLADDTGGQFFHNSNDLDQGFRKTGGLPEVYYVLGFSPQNLKLDGRFHTLKVSLTRPAPLTLQARRGYYAPRQPVDASTRVKEEIEQVVFSQDELNELPVDVHTQFFKSGELDARLSVLTHVDLRFVRFRKEEGRNLNKLTVVTALFDRDGKYVSGKQKLLEFRLLDGSLEKLSESGITMKTSFDVKPGTYKVRQVVRDAEGAQMSALNRTVEIPF